MHQEVRNGLTALNQPRSINRIGSWVAARLRPKALTLAHSLFFVHTFYLLIARNVSGETRIRTGDTMIFSDVSCVRRCSWLFKKPANGPNCHEVCSSLFTKVRGGLVYQLVYTNFDHKLRRLVLRYCPSTFWDL